MSKELENIIGIIKNKKEIEYLKIRGEKKEQEQEIAEEKNKKEFFLKKSEEIMGKLGVTQIFEDLRDNGVLKYSTKPFYEERRNIFGKKELVIVSSYIPAKISFSNYSTAISISFDESYDEIYNNWYPKVVSVRQENDDRIMVSGCSGRGIDFIEQAELKEKIPELIVKAILEVQGNVDCFMNNYNEI